MPFPDRAISDLEVTVELCQQAIALAEGGHHGPAYSRAGNAAQKLGAGLRNLERLAWDAVP